jgi:hypothetical protein
MATHASNQSIKSLPIICTHPTSPSVTGHTVIAIAAVLRRIQFTWHTARLHTQASKQKARLEHRLHHCTHCVYAANSGTGTAAVPVSVLTSRSIAVVFYHPLAFCTSASRRLRYQPIACMHLASARPTTKVSRVPRSLGGANKPRLARDISKPYMDKDKG